MTLLVADHLSVGRSGQPVLSGLRFALDAGEVLFLKGPNGAGKTTLLRSLAGLLPVLSGTLTLGGGILFSGHADGIKAQLTVRENLMFCAGLQGEFDVRDALETWNLSALADRLVADLSAGQRRRTGLARLSLSNAEVWLLDEPTSSLDDASVHLFESVLADHCARGGAAIIATHLPIAAPRHRVLALETRTKADVDLEALW